MLASLGLHRSICTVSDLRGPQLPGRMIVLTPQVFSSATIPLRPGVSHSLFQVPEGTTAMVARMATMQEHDL